jgi:fluoroquinolone resistance protein
MADPRPAPTGEQLGWLSVAPPTDQHGQLRPWTLVDCWIEEHKWKQPIVHEQLTLERVQVTAVQWNGPVFRNSVLREVTFERSSFAHARFENVTFERCRFERSTFENCGFDHCRFLDCTMINHNAVHTALRFCEVEKLALAVIDMRDCDLSGTTFVESELQCPRISKTRADTLAITGGELRGADLTACELRKLTIDGVAVEGLRLIDGEYGDVELQAGRIDGLAISGAKFRRLSFARCTELPGVRVLECRIGELELVSCPSVASLLIADSPIDTFAIQASVLYDAAFERLEVGRGLFDGSELTGVLFDGGSWKTLELADVALNDYVAVKHTNFDQLRLDRPKLDPNLDRRLDGPTYGGGSMTWGGARGP